MPPLFVGRQDVFHRLQEIWGRKANPDSVILYGHRRMGKSSILRNLEGSAPPGSLLAVVDLKGEVALTETTRHLLRGLANAICWAAQERGLPVPDLTPAESSSTTDAGLAFRQLLRRVLGLLPDGASLILALDEFEAVDEGVQAGKIGQEIYDYLRSLSQEPRIVLVFAGLHTLDEMSRNYKAAFFDSYVNLRVSYLSRDAAKRLITRPTPDFAVNYHPAVVQRIIHETHGQPLLVQRLCQELVNHLNHELFDLGRDREVRVLPEDLEAVLSDEFVREESRYFEGIWRDQVDGQAGVEVLLQALVAGPATLDVLTDATGLSAREATKALEYLQTRDLVSTDRSGQYDVMVPLMRRWLRLRRRQ